MKSNSKKYLIVFVCLLFIAVLPAANAFGITVYNDISEKWELDVVGEDEGAIYLTGTLDNGFGGIFPAAATYLKKTWTVALTGNFDPDFAFTDHIIWLGTEGAGATIATDGDFGPILYSLTPFNPFENNSKRNR